MHQSGEGALALNPDRAMWPRRLGTEVDHPHVPAMRHSEYDAALKRLNARLPHWGAAGLRYLVDSSPWVRVPPALLLVVGGLVGFLPILGFWMVPLGLILLAQDVPLLRKPIARAINWADRKWPAKPSAAQK
ncbi:MAG TPA: hypothetical protein VM867_06250 [Xanthobacteraceae bacterium]|jgi:hypothetical protein|nr:hypothetical protein [Xanthobacteraceae bacterium]